MIIDEHTQNFINEHIAGDTRLLSLQSSRYPLVNMELAIRQIEGLQIAATKLPSWIIDRAIIFPPKLSMEQCSSEKTARYKASLMQGKRLTDLTGGFGIDCSYMSERFFETTYVERNSELCNIARHNFALLNKRINVINGYSEMVLQDLPEQDWIFIDPARRSRTGGKVVALEDCEPNVCQLEALLLQKAEHIMIKCSPMLDIALAMKQLRFVNEVYIVSVNNDCKELLFILDRKATGGDVCIHSVNFHGEHVQDFVHTIEQEASSVCVYTAQLGKYLYEPNSSMMKAGCFRLPASRWNLGKLHRNTHLYTSDILIEDFPGRIFEVKEILGFSKKDLKGLVSNTNKANISIRNFPGTPNDLRKRLKLADGGDTFIFATTLQDEKKVLIICSKLVQ